MGGWIFSGTTQCSYTWQFAWGTYIIKKGASSLNHIPRPGYRTCMLQCRFHSVEGLYARGASHKSLFSALNSKLLQRSLVLAQRLVIMKETCM